MFRPLRARSLEQFDELETKQTSTAEQALQTCRIQYSEEGRKM